MNCSPSRTTLGTLPPEVLDDILSCAVEGTMYYLRFPQLRTFALVCRSWRHSSQSLLWHYVHLKNVEAARRFVASDPTRSSDFAVKWLDMSFSPRRGVDEQTVREVVRCCRALRRVTLSYFTAMDAEVLQEEALKDVTNLQLRETRFSPLPHPPLALRFRLTALTIDAKHLSLPFLTALFVSSSRTLRNLRVLDYGEIGNFLSVFPIVAASLTELHLPEKYPNMALFPLLTECKALHTLITDNDFLPHLSAMLLALSPKATLRYLDVIRSQYHYAQFDEAGRTDVEAAACLEQSLDFPGLAAIERIRVVESPVRPKEHEEVREWVGGEGFVEACSRRGVVLIYE